jgi:multisubunit Na+/H+ antiporter MnhB subunit
MPAEVLDVLLGTGLCWLAWRVVSDRDLIRSAVLFIALGLLAALAWARLDAPDLAIAEAAIGAGVTGVLFLDAAGALRRDPSHPRPDPAPGRLRLAAIGTVAALVAGAGLAVAVADLPATGRGLAGDVEARLGETGVSNPVTGVLLSFRSWDTLLEVAVLLAGAAAVLVLRREWAVRMLARRGTDELLRWFARIGAAVVVLVAGFLLWLGGAAPGGAFQAGALLGALALALALGGAADPAAVPGWLQRATLAVGTGLFCALALLTMAGPGPLAWPGGLAYEAILAVETAIAVSVGAALGALVLVAKPPRPDAPDEMQEA